MIIYSNYAFANSSNAQKVSNLIYPSQYFSGRENYLQNILKNHKSGKNIVSLTGITGIGKSQIARQYALQNRENYMVF
ncbi:P-loop NTPase family protein [Candidatus Jidaibacter acanthamoebae]|uniref:hypothetical protein n=1 Tax=Candidatus Jidaibacter acanthamoebae TaxID=86105 RepID=UPI00126A028D|nr:hypothetical protein [Candidatus Jidaibacter acanthamoeba]